MDKNFLEKQKAKASECLQTKEGAEKQRISIVVQYISSILEAEKFTDIEREDLRKLALELDYKEDTSFDEWEKTRDKNAERK